MSFLETITPPMFGVWSLFMFWIGYLGVGIFLKRRKKGGK